MDTPSSNKTINLGGKVMTVSSTDTKGVVSPGTQLYFTQKGQRVLARYYGPSVKNGCLVGETNGPQLVFQYTQLEASGEIHGGRSICDVQQRPGGAVRIIEHFTWRTRAGSGINIFDEVR
jgi:hypothetical protein